MKWPKTPDAWDRREKVLSLAIPSVLALGGLAPFVGWVAIPIVAAVTGALGLLGRVWIASRIGLEVWTHAVLFPRPYTLRVDQLGDIGQTPRLWLGGGLALVFRLH